MSLFWHKPLYMPDGDSGNDNEIVEEVEVIEEAETTEGGNENPTVTEVVEVVEVVEGGDDSGGGSGGDSGSGNDSGSGSGSNSGSSDGTIIQEEEEFFVSSQVFKVQNINPPTYTVYVECPNGTVPDSAIGVDVTVKNTADYAAAATSVFGASITPKLAFDIEIVNANRQKVALTGTVTVRIEYGSLSDVTTPAVLHIKDDGSYEVIKASVSNTNEITFNTRSMSVFAAVDLADIGTWSSYTVDCVAAALSSSASKDIPIAIEYNGEYYQVLKVFGAYGEFFNGTKTFTLILPDVGTNAIGHMTYSAVNEVTVATNGAVSQALDPGKIYHFTGTLTSLAITLTAVSVRQTAHYHFDFDSGSTVPTLSLPASVVMTSNFYMEANKHYEIDIFNNYGMVVAWTIS